MKLKGREKYLFISLFTGLGMVYTFQYESFKASPERTPSSVQSPAPQKTTSSTNPYKEEEKKRTRTKMKAAVSPTISSFEKSLEQAKALLSCQTEGCDLPESDPRSYEIQRGKKILSAFKALAHSSELVTENITRIEPLIFKALSDANPFIQQAALEILQTLPPQHRYLKPLIEGLNSTSPHLVHMTITELLKYKDQPDSSPQIHQAIQFILQRGSPFAAKTLLSQLKYFITQDNYSEYKKLTQTLTSHSMRRQLEALLEEFQERS